MHLIIKVKRSNGRSSLMRVFMVGNRGCAVVPPLIAKLLVLSACVHHEAGEPAGNRLYVSSDPALRSFFGDGPINMTRSGVALKGYDVVAYFTENSPVKGSREITADYEGAEFWFSSTENRDRFLADPASYIPAYGGFCALGVANGYKDDMHPASFTIVDGRLYFNLTPRIHEAWKDYHRTHIWRADDNWSRLRNAPGYGPADAR